MIADMFGGVCFVSKAGRMMYIIKLPDPELFGYLIDTQRCFVGTHVDGCKGRNSHI